MPRAARFKIAAIGELCRQLMYAPPAARRRHMEAAECLVEQIDPQQVYPEEFIIFRITGYRPDSADEPVSLVGEALVDDLGNLIQRLSQSLDLSSDDRDRTAIPLDELARRWEVSTKTLQRYRKQGLVCHSVVFGDGVRRLACFDDSLQRFAEGHRDQLAKAAAFSRVRDTVQSDIIRDARDLHRELGLSLNTAAKRLAGTYGRAHETVRSVLQRHDRRAAEPIFADAGPLTPRDGRLIHRAVRMGVRSSVLARRFGKTIPTIHRAMNQRRGELLRGLVLSFLPLPEIGWDDAESEVLTAPAVTTGLTDGPPCDDALALIEAVHNAAEPDEDVERVLVVGYNLLKRRARDAIQALEQYPSSHALDAIETDLRWATLLKRRLVVEGMPAAVSAVEQALHGALAQQPSDEMRTFLTLAFEVVAQAVQTHDPIRGGRLAHRCGYAMTRAMAARQSHPRPGRATARHQPGSVRLADPFASLDPWQAWLDLRADLQRVVGDLDEPLRQLVSRRYGLDGTRPLTVSALAQRTHRTAGTVSQSLRKAEAELKRLATATAPSADKGP